MQLRRSDRTVSLKFPGENIGVIFIIAQRFSVRSLVFLPKMASAGFVAGECIGAHELGELQKIGDAPGAFEGLVVFLAGSENPDVPPKLFSQLRNPGKRFAQSGGISRHSAFIPKK